jgi:nicotinamide riboside kinase
MIKVALAGAQDTGKTTVARMMSGNLSSRGILTHYVQEFARDYIPKAGSIDSLAEELFLLEQQAKREKETPGKMQVMITDSPVFLAYIYSTLMVDLRRISKKDVMMLGRIYDKVLDHGGYDLVILLPIKWAAADDGVRPEALRRVNEGIAARIGAFITLHGIVAQKLTTESAVRHAALSDYARQAEALVMSMMGEKSGQH